MIWFLLVLSVAAGEETTKKPTRWSFVGNPLLHAHPCNGSEEIVLTFEPGLPPGEENQYFIHINIEVPKHTQIDMEFDSEATVELSKTTDSSARITTLGKAFHMRFFANADSISFTVKGPPSGTVPYFKSLMINKMEYCEEPLVGFLDGQVFGHQNTAQIELKAPEGCGRRKVEHTELIVNGETTKPGDWPWHVAIYKLAGTNINYICGGTLISKSLVLTAAHCGTIRGVPVLPEVLSVVLGKHNLIGGDLASQEREVHSVIVHPNFEPKHLDNDIALLKLKTEAVFDDYIQPACLWHSKAYERLPGNMVFGTVVGWGFDQTDTLSSQLKQTSMPKVAESTCIKKNPLFYANILNNDKKFCAGWANGTSACNGDSGGGFLVFVPDTAKDDSANAAGAWHIRGIVSLAASRRDVKICDPHQYVVFTDVAKYNSWVLKHMKDS